PKIATALAEAAKPPPPPTPSPQVVPPPEEEAPPPPPPPKTATLPPEKAHPTSEHAASPPKEGPTPEMIRETQQLLASLGYHPGSADGRLGPMTRAAVEVFQRRNGLPVTGVPSPIVLQRLRETAAAAKGATGTGG